MKPATVSKLPQIFQASECFENIGEFTIHYLFQSLLLVTYQMSQLFHNNYDINETDTVGLRQVFETVAMRAATYHANKIQKNQYQLHKQVLESKIHALMNYGMTHTV